jgi:hypothetical protein
MPIPESIHDYRVTWSGLGERTEQNYPALHDVGDPVSPRIASLLRMPFPVQILAAMGVVRKGRRSAVPPWSSNAVQERL